MTEPVLEVLSGGALTTVQDLGRFGYQRFGVSVCGCMDEFATQIANLLVGNDIQEPVIEVTLLGPRIRFLRDVTIAIAGGDLSAKLNQAAMSPWSSRTVRVGDELTFGGRVSGARVSVAIQGGISVPKVMGSRSTDLRARFGGYSGRALKAGDVLLTTQDRHRMKAFTGGRSILPTDLSFLRPANSPIRILREGGNSSVSNDVFELFLGSIFAVKPESDRMGFRLDGFQALTQEMSTERWSEPVTRGTVQLPPSGQPIVLMADRQTVGGYAKVGTVVSVDIDRLAQTPPEASVSFSEISLTEAHALIEEQRRYLAILRVANL